MGKIKIITDDGIINESGDNPFGSHIIPPIGSKIIYKTFRQNKNGTKPILDIELEVQQIEFIVEEGWNGKHECSINVHCLTINTISKLLSDIFPEN